jgi:hypothetical protein
MNDRDANSEISDRIKITLSSHSIFLLKNRALAFGFRKSDGQANLNLFLNNVLTGMLFSIRSSKEEIEAQIANIFGPYLKKGVPDKAISAVASLFLASNERLYKTFPYRTKAIYLRPSSSNYDDINCLINENGKNLGQQPSTFLGKLLEVFTTEPLYIQELIAFSRIYQRIEELEPRFGKIVTKCYCFDKSKTIIPMDLLPNFEDGMLYLTGIEEDKPCDFLYFPLCGLKSIPVIKENIKVAKTDLTNYNNTLNRFLISKLPPNEKYGFEGLERNTFLK